MSSVTKNNGVTCVIPAFNEESTIQDVIEQVQKVKEVTEVIVVDDGSTDKTAKIASSAGARVIKHRTNLGKGAAMKNGADAAKNPYIVYVDADLLNLQPAKIRKLVAPLVAGEADFVKGSYSYSGGRVSKLVVKPLLKIVYPFIDLEHPLSGEVALNKRKFRMENIEDGWGVDIQLVLQAARKKLRITEVILGKKEHKHQDLDALSNMSEQIIRTILAELKLVANKYKIVFIDLDKTLISDSSIEILARQWGFNEELKQLREQVASGKLPDKEITKTLVKHFKGRTQDEIDEVCATMTINPFAEKVIAKLREQRFRVRICSAAYSPVVDYFARKLNVHDYICPRVKMGNDGHYEGELKPSRFEDKTGGCCGMYVCKQQAVDFVRKRFNWEREDCMSIGDGKSDRCMFASTGLALGYQTDIADIEIQNFAEVLMYVD